MADPNCGKPSVCNPDQWENAKINTEDEVVEEIISSAVIKFSKRFPEASVEVKMPEEFLMVAMDGVLIEQVLVNLLENAVLHGKTYTKIWIVVTHTPGRVEIAVEDDGQGIKESVLPVMFEGKISSDEKSRIQSGIWESAYLSATVL